MADPPRPTNTSATLLCRVQNANDASAWSEFVERYAPQIYAWCLRYSLQDSDAADVTQDVLCKLVTSMRTFRYEPSKGRFRGWLKTVTVNVVRDMARQRSASTQPCDQQMLAVLEDEQATLALTESIEAAWRAELLAAAEASVQLRVQPHTWEAYRLTSVEQVAARQAAEQLGVPVADVYVAKSRVIKMLREEVKRLDDSLP